MNCLVRTEEEESFHTDGKPWKVRDARASAGMPTMEVDNDQVGLRMCSQGDKTRSHGLL